MGPAARAKPPRPRGEELPEDVVQEGGGRPLPSIDMIIKHTHSSTSFIVIVIITKHT